MAETLPLTLKNIAKHWLHPELYSCTNMKLCYALLPDAYNPEYCTDSSTSSLISDTSDSTLAKFVKGNRSNRKNFYYGHSALTRDLILKLKDNSIIIYQDGRPSVSYKQNMLDKINGLVQTTSPPITSEHQLFTELHFPDIINVSHFPESFKMLKSSIQQLSDNGSEAAITYAIFLLVLTSIIHKEMPKLEFLYNETAITQVIESKNLPTIDNETTQIPFSDPHYMHAYHIYLYRTEEDRLYEQGSLRMSVDSDGRTSATMIMEDSDQIPGAGQKPIVREFTGAVMLSKDDCMVYSGMTNPDGIFAFLCFQYEPFRSYDMYYRSALFLKSTAKSHIPQVQKVAITTKSLAKEEIPYIKGVLRNNGKQIMLTEQQLNQFCTTFADYSWMSDFKENILPFIRHHEQKCYCFNENEVLSYSLSDSNELDRLRITLALKSVDSQIDPDYGKFVRCNDPNNLYKLMK